MAFLRKPRLRFGTPNRPSPTTPGTVEVSVEVPLIVEILEKCFVANCHEAVAAHMFDIVAEIWSTDRSEPIGTVPIGSDRKITGWMWSPFFTVSKRVKGQDLSNASPITGDPNRFLLNFTDSHPFPESTFNEDWGPFPPPAKPAATQTLDELFLRVSLSTVFSSWQVIQTIDSDIVTGQFYGP